jgi:HAD superfamily hydrolase (TIGR01509 family)
MIKLIISDFDGVLLDLKEIHYESLNRALLPVGEEFLISPEDHVKDFDGLSTKKKLHLLNKLRGLSPDKFDEINDLKQKFTVELLESFDKINYDIVNVIEQLKEDGFKFYVASNAIRNTVELGLKKLGISHLVDKIYSNQDVTNSKPNPEMYLRCMADASCAPSETLIMEDSKHGREAAVKSGAYVCGVDNSFDFTYERIHQMVKSIQEPTVKWAGKSDVNVLIPMAGAGSRFVQQGYKLPKPLIDVNGKPMIQRVIENLNIDANYIFVVQKQHYEQYNLGSYLELMAPGCKIIQTDGLTEGAACTTLLARNYINNDNHLLIANSDQFIEWNSNQFMYNMISNDCDGGILTFNAQETKWSYAKTDDLGYVTEVAEKKVISNDATVGIYYWKHGKDFAKFSEQMISKNIRINNEFYVCPVYNEAVQENKKIKIFPVDKMFGLGTPEDLQYFLCNNCQ